MIIGDTKRHLFPNECRLKNITYATTIQYEIDVEFMIFNKSNGKYVTITKTFPEKNKYELGSFPIMLKSDLCILKSLHKDVAYQLGECRHDYGGYFIIDGKEKVHYPARKIWRQSYLYSYVKKTTNTIIRSKYIRYPKTIRNPNERWLYDAI